jgi:hypothetical protein
MRPEARRPLEQRRKTAHSIEGEVRHEFTVAYFSEEDLERTPEKLRDSNCQDSKSTC